MEKPSLTKMIIMLSSILILFAVVLLFVKTFLPQSDRFYEPYWVIEARNNVNPAKCSPGSCGSCDSSGCLKYSDYCYLLMRNILADSDVAVLFLIANRKHNFV